jgi:ribonuclease J
MIVVLTLDRASCTVIAGPNIVSRGVIYVRESENLMEEAQGVVEEAVDRCLERKNLDRNKLKTEIRDALGDFLWKKMKRDPVILPIIMEV